MNSSVLNVEMNLNYSYGSRPKTMRYGVPSATAQTWKKKYPASPLFQTTAVPELQTAHQAAVEASTETGRRPKSHQNTNGKAL
jgi:hypothetical protein